MSVPLNTMVFYASGFGLVDGRGPCADITRNQKQQNYAAGKCGLIFAHVVEHVDKYSPGPLVKERPHDPAKSSTSTCDGVLGLREDKASKLGRHR